MELTTQERDRRWSALREIMTLRDVDVIIAHSDLGDFRGHQRYLSGYRATFDDIVTLVFREGPAEMVHGHPAIGVFAKALSWIDNPIPLARPVSAGDDADSNLPSVGGALANILSTRETSRIGVADLARLPIGWEETISSALPDAEFTDVGPDLVRQRLVKSLEEQTFVREASRISDLVWAQMPEIVRPGRKRYEVMADIEHCLRSNGCEDSYNLFEALPLLESPKDRRPFSALPIEAGDVFTVEVSPRYLGYYAQQTGLVALGDIPTDMRKAYDGINRARQVGLSVAKAGVDIVEMTAAVHAQLSKDGLQPASPLVGHFVGLQLEDAPAGNMPLILEEGMTLILHPFAAGFPGLLRADTYLITASGAELLTSGNEFPLVI